MKVEFDEMVKKKKELKDGNSPEREKKMEYKAGSKKPIGFDRHEYGIKIVEK